MVWKVLHEVTGGSENDRADHVRNHRALKQNYIRFSPQRGSEQLGWHDSFVFLMESMEAWDWKPGTTKLVILVDEEKQRILLQEHPDGNLLTLDANSSVWSRIHCPRALSPLLRKWLCVDPSKKTQVAFNVKENTEDVNRDGIIVSFGEKQEFNNWQKIRRSSNVGTSTALAGKESPLGTNERMLQWFAYSHLPEPLKVISWFFFQLAHQVCDSCEPGPERTVALRKLLEAKDAAVRSKVNPGG